MSAELLFVQGAADQARSDASRACEAAVLSLAMDFQKAFGAEDALERVQSSSTGDAGRPPAVAIIDADVAKPLALARRLARILPNLRFVLAVATEREAEVRSEAVFGAPPGGRWSLLGQQGAPLTDAILTQLKAARQNDRLRTTLDKMRLLATSKEVDPIEYRRLLAADRHLALVLENASDAIVTLSSNGAVVSWNRGAQQLFEIAPATALSMRLCELFDERDACEESFRRALANGTASNEMTLRGGAERRRYVDARFDRVTDDKGGAIGVVAILRDITERHMAEETLREANRQKDEFLAMLAHELRNPLAPIRNAVELLQIVDANDPRTKRAHEIIGRQVKHMTGMIDDLLDVARVTRGAVALNLDRVSIDAVIDDAVEQVSGQLNVKGQTIERIKPATDAFVYGDRLRLTQIVSNLLHNSVKYTPEGGRTTVASRALETQVEMVIQDTGIGIEPELLPEVFEIFSQGKRSNARSEGGLGVGLALVKQLVHLHGGLVTATSLGLGQGSTFCVVFPRMDSVERPSKVASKRFSEAANEPQPSSLALVVVDDNRDAAESLTALLEAFGHSVKTFVDSREALAYLETASPDVAILDIGMPFIDGYQLAAKVKASTRPARPLLIALTGYGQTGDRDRALASGFDHHLVKPLDVDFMASLLAKLQRQA